MLPSSPLQVESLEQKAKCGSSKWSAGSRGERRRSSLLPEEVKESETRLAQSMETYRQRCDNLGVLPPYIIFHLIL